ncbi:MAG TPA: SRPBCC family protein [Oligoflexia bacterium]|nr:SRPBCC family protein [Oligoflexia bacterium]HMP47763.1 SRPBCC family protein [Oligoflexia bacterium]
MPKENEIIFGFNDSKRCFTLFTELIVPHSREKVFPFFASAENLEHLTPDFLNFRILSILPIEMNEGTLIDYKISLHHIPIKWRTRISSWKPPFMFIDEQINGPYLYWLHEHHFEEIDQACRIIDKVYYRVFGGKIINNLFIKGELNKIFTYRRKKMTEIFY